MKFFYTYIVVMFFVLSNIKGQTLDVNFFNNLLTTKLSSTPNFEWQQFGPGMSGYCEEFWTHPTDPNALYQSPDLFNTYGSFDNGVSWNTIKERDGNGRDMRRVQSIIFSHQDENFGYAIDVRGILYNTTDKGRNWNFVRNLPEGRHSELAVDTSDDQNWYIGAGDFWNVKQVHRSVNRLNGLVARFVAYGHILKSSDRGATWERIEVDPSEPDLAVGRIIVDPRDSNIVIAATTFGVYRSTDQGDSWNRITGSGLPNNLPRDMTFHYDETTNEFTLYLVEQTKYEPVNTPGGMSIESIGGVYKSTDSGLTWTSITGDLAIDMTQITPFFYVDDYFGTVGRWLELSGSNREIGRNTRAMFPVLPTSTLSVFNRLVVNPLNKNEIYVSHNSRHDFSFYPGDVWKTEDGGTTWFPCVRSGEYWENDRTGDPGRDAAYWNTRNNGNTALRKVNTTHAHLQREIDSDFETFGNRFLEINSVGDVFICLDQQMLRSNNGGISWEQADDFETAPGSKKWIGRGASNLPGRFMLLNASGIPGRHLLCSGEHGLWQTDADNGGTGATLTVAVEQIEGQVRPRAAKSIASVATHPNDPNIIYILMFRQDHRGLFRRSLDGGASWENIGNPLEGDYSGTNISQDHVFQYSLTVDPDNPDNIYFCTMENPFAEVSTQRRITRDVDLGVKKSTDGGRTWVTSNSGLPTTNFSVRRIKMDPADSSTLYAALNESRNGTPGGLYRSRDNASTWQRITIPSAIRAVNNVHIDKTTGDLFISCGRFQRADSGTRVFRTRQEGGVWRSSDEGLTWNKIFDYPFVSQTETSPVNPDIITVSAPLGRDNNRAITLFNPGAYMSRDGGSTWMKISNNLGQTDVIVDLKPDPLNEDIFWCAQFGSAWTKGRYTGPGSTLSVTTFENTNSNETISLYPNPVGKENRLFLNAPFFGSSQVFVELFDINGRKLFDVLRNVEGDNTEISFSTNSLESGVYLLKVSNNNNSFIKRFIKE